MGVVRTGTTGKDHFEAGIEAEDFDGLREYDTVSYRESTSGLTLDLRTPANSTGFAEGDTFVGIERYLLSHFDDLFFGSAGNESVNGADGDDIMYGGDGRDTLTGHSGNDQLFGENGNDGMFGGGGHDTLSGGEGDDGLRGDGGDDYLDGGAGADRLFGGIGNDILIGGTGDDTVTGEAGDDVIFYSFGDGADTLTGDLGDDTLVFAISSSAFDQTIEDDLRALQDHLDQSLNGVGGDRSVLYSQAGGALTNFAALGFSISTIEQVTIDYDGTQSSLSDFLNQLVPPSQYLVDEPGSQSLVGGAGDDTIVANTGNDVYDGGDGVDTLDMSAATGRANVNLENGTARGLGRDTVSNIENVIGSDGNDNLRGSDAANDLVGGEGNDRLDGRAGDDTLSGGAGNDRLNGGSGRDVLDGGDGADRLNGGTGDDSLDGGAGNDRLNGGGGNDTISDGDGNDRINGGNGDDIVIAGSGRDNFNGGRGFDSIDFSAAGAALQINLDRRTVEGDGDDQIRNFEAVTGSSFDDTIIGSNRGGEHLNGGDGDDVIRSMRGEDVLNGGAGSDTFVFDTADVVRGRREYGADQIEDFTTADTLDFTDFFSGNFAANDVLSLSDDGATTTVSAQIGRGGTFVDIVHLNGVTGLEITQMIDDGLLIV